MAGAAPLRLNEVARPRDRSIDRAVIDACVELLEEVGRHRLSREQIARRAGVSLPAVNRRFDSVDDILLAVAGTACCGAARRSPKTRSSRWSTCSSRERPPRRRREALAQLLEE